MDGGEADRDEETARLERLDLAGARAGDGTAFGRLAGPLEPRLFRAAVMLCGEREEARDLLQETMVNLYAALPRFSGRCGLYTYAYRIMLNLNAKRLRRRNASRRTAPARAPVTAGGPVPDRELATRERAEAVRLAVAGLPVEFQAVVTLRYLEEFSLAEIAGELGLSEGTVKSRLSRAKDHLRRRLGRFAPA